MVGAVRAATPDCAMFPALLNDRVALLPWPLLPWLEDHKQGGWVKEAVEARFVLPHVGVAVVDGNYPLHIACNWSYFVSEDDNIRQQVVGALLAAYPKAAEEKNGNGDCPLHIAVSTNASQTVVRTLLTAFSGAAGIKNDSSNFLLHIASQRRNILQEVVIHLLNVFPDAAREKVLPLEFHGRNFSWHDPSCLRQLLRPSNPLKWS